MSKLWFKRWGWFYRPIHPLGFAVTLAALAFVAQVFVAVDRHSHSASDTLYNVYPFAVSTLLALLWIASRASGETPA